MARLSEDYAAEVEEAEALEGYALLPNGLYKVRLREVEAKSSQAGNPIWNVQFDEIEDRDGGTYPGRQFTTLNLPYPGMNPNATLMFKGKMKEFFTAFGYTTDTDTDEMLGEYAIIEVRTQTIQKGPRAGELSNTVHAIFPLSKWGEPGVAGEDSEY